jgi:hypothetical protein
LALLVIRTLSLPRPVAVEVASTPIVYLELLSGCNFDH